MHLSKPKDPIRDVLKAMTGKSPPAFVKGYTCYALSDKEWDLLQSWAVNNCKPSYLTGIGLLDAAHHQVEEAVSNGNIPAPSQAAVDPVVVLLRLLRAVSERQGVLLARLGQANRDQMRQQREKAEATCPKKTHTRSRSSKKATWHKASSKWRMSASSTRS